MLSLLFLALSGAALAEDAWTTAPVELQRWPQGVEGSVVTASVAAGERVTVVTDRGDQVRVYTAGRFGWVARDQLTDAAPPPPEDPPAAEGDDEPLPFDVP